MAKNKNIQKPKPPADPLRKWVTGPNLPFSRIAGGFTLIELVVSMGIVILITGACTALLLSSKVSLSFNEASIQAEEKARQAISRISKELRLSQSGKVYISGALGTAINYDSGNVINFQIPVGTYGTKMALDSSTNQIEWGTNTTKDSYIAYQVNGTGLIRSTYTYNGSAVNNLNDTTITPQITAVNFQRISHTSNLINVTVTAQGTNLLDQQNRTISTNVKLRN